MTALSLDKFSLLFSVLVALGLSSCGGAPPPTTQPGSETEPAVEPPLPWEAEADPPPEIRSHLTVIQGGTVMTAAGEIHTPGVVVMENGRIRDVGAPGDVEIPAGARIVDATDRFVTPGIIDTHSHMGVYSVPHVRATSDGNESTNPVTAGVWAGDSFWPGDPALPRAIAGGVTTIHVLPGSANLIGGRGVTLKMHLGRTLSEMLFPAAPMAVKMACGENPKRVYGGRNTAPATRMGSVLGYRTAFQGAREYGRSWRDWQHNHRLWQERRRAFERGAVGDGDMEPVSDGDMEPSVMPVRSHRRC